MFHLGWIGEDGSVNVSCDAVNFLQTCTLETQMVTCDKCKQTGRYAERLILEAYEAIFDRDNHEDAGEGQ